MKLIRRLGLVIVFVVFLGVVLLNASSVPFNLYVVEFHLPLVVLVMLAFLIGVLVGLSWAWLKYRHRHSSAEVSS